MGDAPGLQRYRFRDQLLAGPLEQIAVRAEVEFIQQPVHRFGIRFKNAVRVNMHDVYTLPFKSGRDEKGSVAIERLFLCAHESDAVFSGPSNHAFDTVPETIRQRDAVITDAAALVTSRIFGAAAEFAPEIDVSYASPLESGREGFAIKLRVEAAVRCRAHIRHGPDAVQFEESREGFPRMIGVADSKNAVFHIFIHPPR